MNKIFMLATASIRKTKAQTVTLVLLFVISSMLMNIGLMVSLNFGSFYEKTAEELRTSDAYFIIPDAIYNDDVENYIKAHKETKSFAKNTCVITNPKLFNNDTRWIAFFDKNEDREVSQWKLVSETLPETENSVYLPYQFKVGDGYDLGDTISVDFNGKAYSFIISGFVEDIFFSSYDMAVLSFYLPSGRYMKLSDDLADFRATVVFTDVKNNYKSIESGLVEQTGASLIGAGDVKNMIISFDRELTDMSRTMVAVIISVMMVVFAVLIVAVCLLVIRFRIGNSIEEDMPKIGSLMSVGYTSGQIASSIIAQYGIIALLGSLIGIIPAYFSLPWVGDVFAIQSGLLWKQGFDPGINIVTVITLLLVVVIVSLTVALKIRKIAPVQALRGGIATHNFRRNYIRFEKTRLPLIMVLSFKSVLQNIKQSIMVFAVLTAVAFMATFSIVMFYNSAVNTHTFAEVPGVELSNAVLVLSPAEDAEAFRNDVLAYKDVRKAQYLDDTNIYAEGSYIIANVMNDYSGRETNVLCAGRYPIYNNEAAISVSFANMNKKEIGDTVLVGEAEKPYIVTGLTQGSGNGGLYRILLTLDGMLKVQPDFKQMSLQVYLRDEVSTQDFIDEMQKLLSEKIVGTANIDKSMEQGMSSYASIVSVVGQVILAIAGFVIILVLYFVISSSVIRRRRELGIQKAIGYTTLNLMNQVSIGFLLPLIIGIGVGCVIGVVCTNPIMALGMSGMGIVKANFIIPLAWVTVTGVGMAVLSYTASMFITWRIRKISVYALVTE